MKFSFGIKSNPGIPFLIALVLGLLFFFGFSLAGRLAAPPSKEISREIVIGELDYGFSRTINCHTHLLEVPGSEIVTVFAVDGSGIRLIDLDAEGVILNDRRLELDLSQSSLIQASYSDPESIRVFYMKNGILNKVDIPVRETSPAADPGYSESLVSRGVDSFSADGGIILFQREDGLFAYREESPSPRQLLPAGEIFSFRIIRRDSDVFVLAVVKADWDRADLHLLRCDEALRLIDDAVLLKDAPLKFYRELKDARIAGDPRNEQTLTALYSYRNRQDKLNTLTLQIIDLSQGSLRDEIRSDFPYYNSRYSIVDAGEETIRFIVQFDGRHSVDLGLCAIKRDGSYSLRPLTRTRNVSKLTGFFNREGRDALVFTDLEYEKRMLQFASGTDRMMEETTRLSSVSFVYPLLTTILVFLVSLVSGVLFLMVVMPLPFAVSLLADRSLRIKGAVGFSLLTVFTAAFHTGLQILFTMNILHARIDTSYFPVFAGRGPWIFILLILLAMASYAVARRDMKGEEYGSRSLMVFYVRYAVYGYLVYVPLFLMYVFNAVLLSKI